MDDSNIPNQVNELKKQLLGIYKRRQVPDDSEYLQKLQNVLNVLGNEKKQIRPRDSIRKPGGLLYLHTHIPTVIVPDLHARIDFFLSIMMYKIDGRQTILEWLDEGKLQVVCVGDGFHGERRAAKRWRLALEEYRTYYKKHKFMDDEMRESLGLMEMVIELKTAYPDYFHFLKGNHENISNENAYGNKPFGKFAYEGEMVKTYMGKFYSEEFIQNYYKFEKMFPLLAIGRNFLISHAEPRIFHSENPVIDYNMHAEVIYDLTWTADNAAEESSVTKMLKHYLNSTSSAEPVYYFGGHRPVKGLYNLRAEGKYVQIHNPDKFILAYLQVDKEIELDKDIIEIPTYKV